MLKTHRMFSNVVNVGFPQKNKGVIVGGFVFGGACIWYAIIANEHPNN